jgi:hypothetical protein
MTSLHLRRSAASSDDVDARRALAASTGPWTWLAGAALLFFAVPYVGTDLLGLPPDLYYLIYFTVALGWFAMFLASHRAQLSGLWRKSMRWSLTRVRRWFHREWATG